mmetsp:Transcript_18798/g.43716  ORF Transcript_18798/g.43716 Transcript_18798/m.43716 type:complete len:88 (-) Transcript_18798:1089-1352(-)
MRFRAKKHKMKKNRENMKQYQIRVGGKLISKKQIRLEEAYEREDVRQNKYFKTVFLMIDPNDREDDFDWDDDAGDLDDDEELDFDRE